MSFDRVYSYTVNVDKTLTFTDRVATAQLYEAILGNRSDALFFFQR